VVSAEGLGVKTRRGWVFRGVDLRVAAGGLVAIAGPGGSGRSALLLTVGGRMKPSAGSLTVCGLPLPTAAARVRGRTAVARVGGAAEPDAELRVRDHVRERALAAGLHVAEFDWACEQLEVDLPGGELVGTLRSEQVTLMALALALMEQPAILLLDDLDAGADGPAQHRLWAAARRAADRGPAVLATTTEPSPAADLLVELGA
jgi:ABC-2 type transport system ATP-binding protein